MYEVNDATCMTQELPHVPLVQEKLGWAGIMNGHVWLSCKWG